MAAGSCPEPAGSLDKMLQVASLVLLHEDALWTTVCEGKGGTGGEG